jgi:phospholipase C
MTGSAVRCLALTALVLGVVPLRVRAAEPALTLAGAKGTVGASMASDPAAQLSASAADKLALLRQRVKFVFVLFQENRSFDHYFGTYPGANGIFATFPGAVTSRPAVETRSYDQLIAKLDGSFETLHPFLIPRTVEAHGVAVQLYPEDLQSAEHSHMGMLTSMHFDAATQSVAANDAYALGNEGIAYTADASGADAPKAAWKAGGLVPRLAQLQSGEIAIGHVDCDTIPFLWQYADRFTLFDNFHQTIIGPSTPNAIAMIAAQTGDTQWALHPDKTGKAAYYRGDSTVPNQTDSPPYAGSTEDRKSFGGAVPALPPFGPDEESFPHCASFQQKGGPYDNRKCPEHALPGGALAREGEPVELHGGPGDPPTYYPAQQTLTFASLPLSFMGGSAPDITAKDYHPAMDLADVAHDVAKIAAADKQVPWGWYQQGYGQEPFDGAQVGLFPPGTLHTSYIVHHNGPQYFGYVGDNPVELGHLRGLQQFYTDVANHALPAEGGVFFVRGGYFNNDKLLPADPNPAVQASFPGNDDHPGYSDSQISEALIADNANAIASSPYWAQSAIIITYDETDGFYDHAPLAIRTWGPDKHPESGGPRITAIVISPYAATHVVSHVYSEHGSVVKLINELFNLVPLHALPDETRARALGGTEASLNGPNGPQTNLGPNDGEGVGDMLEAFDTARLQGRAAPVPASVAMIPEQIVKSLPHYGGAGCSTLKITPTDYPHGYGAGLEIDPPPPDFNPRPKVSVEVAVGAQAVGKSYPGNISASGVWRP